MPRTKISKLSQAITRTPFGKLSDNLRSGVEHWHDRISHAPMDTYDKLPAYQRSYWQYLSKIAAKEISPLTPFRKGQ